MPRYEYKCDCGCEKEIFAPMKDCYKKVICECGQEMCKIISLPNTDIVENVRYSTAMGVNPRQIPQAMKMYPGSVYTPDGRLIIRSRKDKLKKMKERGKCELE